MIPNGIGSSIGETRELVWTYNHHTSMEDYLITLLDSEDSLLIRQQFSPEDYTGNPESWTIPDNVVLVNNGIYKWQIGLGARYVDGLETAGAESPWVKFTYYGDP